MLTDTVPEVLGEVSTVIDEPGEALVAEVAPPPLPEILPLPVWAATPAFDLGVTTERIESLALPGGAVVAVELTPAAPLGMAGVITAETEVPLAGIAVTYEVRGSAPAPVAEVGPLAGNTVSALLPAADLDGPDDFVPSAKSVAAAEVEAIFSTDFGVSIPEEEFLPGIEARTEMTVALVADSAPVDPTVVDSILGALPLDRAEPQWKEDEHAFLHLAASTVWEGEFIHGDGVSGPFSNQWPVPTGEDAADSPTAAPDAQATDLLADFILSAERAGPGALNPRTEESHRGAAANDQNNFFGEDSGEEVVSAVGYSVPVVAGVGEQAADTGAEEVVPTTSALPGQLADLLASIVPISLAALDAVIEQCGDAMKALDEGMRFNLGLLMAALAVAAVAGEITRREMQRSSSQQVSAPGGGEPMVA